MLLAENALASIDGCKGKIAKYFPKSHSMLGMIALQESKRLAEESSASYPCLQKYTHSRSQKIKLVCGQINNAQHFDTTNDFCEKFLGPYYDLYNNVNIKIKSKNYEQKGCSFYYTSSRSAIVCAFLKDRDEGELRKFPEFFKE